MFDFGFGELLLLAVIALVVLGPERLPVAARLLGRWIRGARNQWNAVKAELENEIADEELRRNLREASDALRQGNQQLRSLHEGLADAAGQMTQLVAPATPEAATPIAATATATAATPIALTDATSSDAAPAGDPAQLDLLEPAPANGSSDDRRHGHG